MSAKDIVTSLRKIAADPEHRGMLVNEENCLPSLVQFLLGEDSEVSFIALEVIYFLSLHVDNRPKMAQENNLLRTLKKFMMTGKLKEKKVAIAAYTNLQAYASSLPYGTTQEPTQPQPNDSEKNTTKTNNSSDSSSLGKPLQASSLMFSEKSSHAYTIFVSGLVNESAKKEVEGILLKIKGVISIYCDLLEQKVVVRATIPSDQVIKALQDNGKKASTKKKDIITDDSGYLDEQDEGTQSKSSWFGFGGMTKYGNDKKKKDEDGGGWMSRIGKALYIL